MTTLSPCRNVPADSLEPEQATRREVDAGDAVYRFDPDSAHLRAIWRAADAPAREREAFKAQLPEIKRAHESLVARLGVERREVYFVDFREVLSQNDDHANAWRVPSSRHRSARRV